MEKNGGGGKENFFGLEVGGGRGEGCCKGKKNQIMGGGFGVCIGG